MDTFFVEKSTVIPVQAEIPYDKIYRQFFYNPQTDMPACQPQKLQLSRISNKSDSDKDIKRRLFVRSTRQI